MKKITLIAAAIITLFCIIPIATTQAIPHQIQKNKNVATDQLDKALPVSNQKKLHDTIIELSKPALNSYVPSYDNQNFRGTITAKDDTSENSYTRGNNNPYVKRQGHGRSTMRDKIDAADNSNVKDNDDAKDDENFGDNSAIKFNKDLRNSSGYNEDL